MKRTLSRKLRFNAEMNPVAENDTAYIGKHESLVDSIAEIFKEVCEDLAITAEFVAEVMRPAREIARKVTERVTRRIQKLFKVPEVRIPWKYGGFFNAGIYDLPIVYDGNVYTFCWR